MAKGPKSYPPNCKTYSLPLYSAGWVPLDKITPAAAGDEAEDPASPPPTGDSLMLVLAGGGGEGFSGVKNALLLSQFDFSSCSLSAEPVYLHDMGEDIPYRMAVHPGGDGIFCAFPKFCRRYEWDLPKSREHNKLTVKPSNQKMTQLEDKGLQLSVAFNADGSMLATGGEDGHLRVFKWPSMEIILDEADAHATVKALDFSYDAKFLVALGDSGPCRVWDLTSLAVVANLPRENGEMFGFCRFSQNTDNNQILYVTSMHGGQGGIACWDTLSWRRVGTKRIVQDPISAFAVSVDGKFLSVGSIEGDVVIANSDIKVLKRVKKAHVGIITTAVFSQDSRALVSASFDSYVRVTPLGGRTNHGLNIWPIVLVILLAILVYFMRLKGEAI